MTPLEAHIRARIARHGPLNVQQFMEEALGNPEFGYYTTRDPFGEAGDFTTAPEVSQMFGELIGAWLASAWQSMGEPDPVNVIELGPGRGTLMADALRAMRGVPGLIGKIQLHLVEISPVLRKRQHDTLGDASVASIDWWRDISQIAAGPSLIVANEFYDALPIRQYVRDLGHWRERMVEPADAGFRFALSAEPVKAHLIPEIGSEAKNGDIVETSPAGLRSIHTVAQRLLADNGAALIIDYGHTRSALGESLQAVRGHRFSDVLAMPGEQDLTAHVDFAALGTIAESAGAVVHGPVTQAAFLAQLGIDIRLQALMQAAETDETRADLIASARRLIDPDAMGHLFKVMAVTSPALPKPEGFDH